MSKKNANPTDIRFGKRLLAVRTLRRYSQTELAKLAGFQPAAISHFENARRQPSLKNLRKLAIALDVSVDDLV
jgi:transcriptional regulator with XRE-family HTH domain